MFEWVWTSIAREWLAVTSAPFLYVAASSAICTIVWIISRWHYSGVIATKDAQISSLSHTIDFVERQRDDYKEKLNGATPEEAKAKIADLERRILILEPRRLTPQQREIIQKVLASSRGQNHALAIVHDMSCSDCNIYADEIGDTIKSYPGYTVHDFSVMSPAVKSPKGVAILSPREPTIEPANAALDPTTELIVQSFSQAGIPFDVFRTGKALNPAWNATRSRYRQNCLVSIGL